MKSTGIERRLDDLGRLTLPIELRRSLGITDRDLIEIFTDEDAIILKKKVVGDIFTGSTENLVTYEGKNVSVESIKAMAKLAGLI